MSDHKQAMKKSVVEAIELFSIAIGDFTDMLRAEYPVQVEEARKHATKVMHEINHQTLDIFQHYDSWRREVAADPKRAEKIALGADAIIAIVGNKITGMTNDEIYAALVKERGEYPLLDLPGGKEAVEKVMSLAREKAIEAHG